MLKERLEKEFFPFVIKPGRYAGNEPGQIIKQREGRTAYLHCFPDKYELAQSYVGLQSIYHIVNSDDRFLCERAFAMDLDAEEIMREKQIPLFSLETRTSAKEFDAIGFTLSFELLFTTVLAMLDLAGIPLKSSDRSDDDPIIMAGGPSVYNPEPLSPFIDLFFIGDAEEGLIEILSIIHEMKDQPRLKKLERIVREVESVYVPAFYDDNQKPTVDFAPAQIKARLVRELKSDFYPNQPILPLIDVVHNFMSVEVMRGCPQGCRFCQAGPIYRPVRPRPIEEIMQHIDNQLVATGYNELTLLSLSSSDYPEIEKLASMLARRYSKDGISIALPSLRPGTITPKILDAISALRKPGLTIAPEAGTERLRLFIRKEFPDSAIYDTVRMAFKRGWTTIKLYFMIGLPTETDEDLDGINKIVYRVQEIGREYHSKKTINVTLSPFAPKPHTPFQWDSFIAPDEVLEKLTRIKTNNRSRNVHFKFVETEVNMLQAILGRGGREMGDVILGAFHKGCRFDGWNDHFDFSKWVEVLEEQGHSLEELRKPLPFSADLPWSHIQKGVSVEHLQKERQRTSTQLKDYIPYETTDANGESANSMSFGRSKKKVPSKSVIAPTKNRLRIRWGKSEELKYMSHLDNIRALERTIRRAKLPVAYSQGYNPTMKLSFGPPLPLGFSSSTEIADIVLDQNCMPSMITDLIKAMPNGMTIVESKVAIAGKKSVAALLNRITYTIPLSKMGSLERLKEKIKEVLSKEKIMVQRKSKDRAIEIDIRSGIYEIETGKELLTMTLGIGDGGYVKPPELLAFLVEPDNLLYLNNQVHRSEMFRMDGKNVKTEAMDL